MGLSFSGLVSAEIYRWVDEQGNVHYSDAPVDGTKAQKMDIKLKSYTTVERKRSTFDAGVGVVLYSASWCPNCRQAKKYFKAKRIRYREYDVEKSAKGKRDFKKLGGGVPIILIGDQRLNGFSVKSFEQMYKGG